MKKDSLIINGVILGIVMVVIVAFVALGIATGFGTSYSAAYNHMLTDKSIAATELIVDKTLELLTNEN